jgi:hypothetical protein
MRGDKGKLDHGKPMWDLLPFRQVREIVKVLTFGAVKYGPNKWQLVKNAEDRYFAALLRHLDAWKCGERFDQETGLHHLAHAGCCLLFCMYFDMKKIKPKPLGGFKKLWISLRRLFGTKH